MCVSATVFHTLWSLVAGDGVADADDEKMMKKNNEGKRKKKECVCHGGEYKYNVCQNWWG